MRSKGRRFGLLCLRQQYFCTDALYNKTHLPWAKPAKSGRGARGGGIFDLCSAPFAHYLPHLATALEGGRKGSGDCSGG